MSPVRAGLRPPHAVTDRARDRPRTGFPDIAPA